MSIQNLYMNIKFLKILKKKIYLILQICSRHICLPIYYGLSESNVKKISSIILEFLKEN